MNLEANGTAEAYCGSRKLGSTDVTSSIVNTVVTSSMTELTVTPQTTSSSSLTLDSTIGTVTAIAPSSIVIKNACP